MPLFDRLIVGDTPSGFVSVALSTLTLLRNHPMTGEEAQWFGEQMAAAGRRASSTRARQQAIAAGQLELSTGVA